MLYLSLICVASPLAGLAETKKFTLHAPAHHQARPTGKFSLVGIPQLRGARISEIRIDDAVLMLPSGALVRGYDYRKKDNIVIGVGNGLTNVSLTSVKTLSNNELELVALFEKDRQPVTPLSKQVAVFDLENFDYLNWSFKNHSRKNKSLAVYVVGDGSSSMESVFPTLKASSKDFFLSMPDGVACSLNTFNSQLHQISKQPEDCKKAAARVDDMVLEGGTTDIYGALKKIYEIAAQDGFSHSLVLVLSDAQQVGDSSKQDALRAKKQVNGKTMVLGLGHFRKDDLVGLADVQSSVGQHVKDDIKNYFKNQSLFVKGLEYIHVKR